MIQARAVLGQGQATPGRLAVCGTPASQALRLGLARARAGLSLSVSTASGKLGGQALGHGARDVLARQQPPVSLTRHIAYGAVSIGEWRSRPTMHNKSNAPGTSTWGMANSSVKDESCSNGITGINGPRLRGAGDFL